MQSTVTGLENQAPQLVSLEDEERGARVADFIKDVKAQDLIIIPRSQLTEDRRHITTFSAGSGPMVPHV